jgi:diguanylate cyclase (GGDEF)-like protein
MANSPWDPAGPGPAADSGDTGRAAGNELDRMPTHADPRTLPPFASPSGPAGCDRRFFASFDDALRRARDRKEPLGLLLVEIDGFAARFGQLAPQTREALLRRVGGNVETILSERDAYTRWRDERLAVLLQGAGRGKTRAVGGRLRSLVEQSEGDQEGDWPITVTIGGACHPADGDTLPELFRRAEDALGEARRLGRNRVWCYVRRPRVPVVAPVHVDGPDAAILGMTRNVSDSGLFLDTSNPVPEGLSLALSIPLPGLPAPIRCVGRVVRQTLDPLGVVHGLGIEFESYGSGAKRLLDTFVGRALVEGRVDYPPLDEDE